MKKNVCVINYSDYYEDLRIRRAAESIAACPGYQVSVLALKKTERPQKYSLRGVDVTELNIAKYQGKSNLRYMISYFKFTMLALFACSKLQLKNSTDIVHVHNMPNFIIFSAIIPRLLGKRVILDVHDTLLETYEAKFAGSARGGLLAILKVFLMIEERLSFKMAHRIICVNQIQKEALVLRGIPSSKIVIVLNMPNLSSLNPRTCGSYSTGLNNHFNLVYHGTIAKRLGIDHAIRAVAQISAMIPHIAFHVIGGGDDMQAFIDLSRELHAEDHVYFSERIPFDELVGVLRKMDLCVVPNRKNAASELMLPVKLLDCVSLGIPVVAARLKTIEYYFSEDMLTFFEPDNVDSLAQAIGYAYRNQDIIKEKARSARQHLEQYSWERQESVLINLYRELS
jgi:glycosyltransferase involved in cell wall biosynthesis